VISMNRRLIGGDQSLNAPLSRDGEGAGEWQDWLENGQESQEHKLGESEETEHRQRLLTMAMNELNSREQQIILSRRLSDPPLTLEDLSQKFSVSRERVRQIEARAFEKLQAIIQKAALKEGLLIEG